MERGINWEENFIIFLQQYQNPFLNFVASLLRVIITDEFICFSTPLFLWLTTPKKGMFLLLTLSLSELLNACIKWFFQVPRPFWISKQIKNIGKHWEQDFSFPSSHAQISSTWVTALILTYGHHFGGIWILALASLVFFTGLARIYLGVHYPTCVLTGWFVGFALSFFLHSLDILTWFSYLDFQHQIMITIQLAILPYFILDTIKKISPSANQKAIKKWEIMANLTTGLKEKKNILTRRLAKYHTQVWTFVGGTFGSILSIKALNENQLRFLSEDCSNSLPIQYIRVILGFGVLILVVPIAFILPKILAKKNIRSEFCDLVKIFGLFAIGFWSTHGLPSVAASMGLECPIFAQPNHDNVNSNFPYVEPSYQFPRNQILGDLSKLPQITIAQNLTHLQSEIQKAHNGGYKVRIIGGGWSSPLQFSNDYNQKILSLNHPSFKEYSLIHTNNGTTLAIVGAGLHIGENPDQDWKMENSFLQLLWNDGYALPGVASFVGQNVGGLISTGASFGSLRYAIADSLVGIKYINGLSQLRTAWRNDTNPTKFYAMALSMGLGGVIYELIFQVEARYCISQTGSVHEKITLTPGPQIVNMLTTCDYARMLMNFYPSLDQEAFGLIDCYNRQITTDVSTCDNTPKADEKVYGINKIQEFFLQVWEEYSFEYVYHQPNYTNENIWNSPLVQKFNLNYPILSRKRQIAKERCLKEISEAKLSINTLSTSGPSKELTNACLGEVIREKEHEKWEPHHYHKILMTDQWIIEDPLQRSDFAEYYFPLHSTNITQLIIKLRQFFHQNQFHSMASIIGPELYLAKSSDFLLSPGYGEDCLRISLAYWWTTKQTNDTESKNYFDRYTEFFLQNNFMFRMHWGKNLPIHKPDIMKTIRNQYPKLKVWKKIIEQEDPNQIFRTDYWSKALWD